MSGPFSEALEAFGKPLRFACRGPEQLERIKDLDATLLLGLRRLEDVANSDAQRDVVAALARGLPPSAAGPKERLSSLSRLLELVDAALAEPRVQRSSEAPPAAARRSRPLPVAAVLPAAQPAAAASEPAAAFEPAAAPVAAAPRPMKREPTPVAGLDAPVQYVKGVGPKLGSLLEGRGLRSVRELLFFFPRRYEDRRAVRAIRDLLPDRSATFEGQVLVKSGRGFRGKRSLELVVGDESGVVQLRWFRVPGPTFADRFAKGQRVRVSGLVKAFRGRLQMVHPEVTLLDGRADNQAADELPELEDALVPVYPEIEQLRPAHLRRIIDHALPAAHRLEDLLPEDLRRRHGLPELADAVASLHRPPAGTPQEQLDGAQTPWHRRLIYEELLLLELAVLQRKGKVQREPGRAIPLASPLWESAGGLLPFTLTAAQGRALSEVEADLRRDVPMQRLLQGDVGSGKTAVALTAAAAVARAGLQAAIMAPTEILAEQHARTAERTLSPAGFRVELLTGHTGAADRRRLLAALAAGEVHVLIGTHALIQDDVGFSALALCIVDEQHRFGVLQRAALLARGRAGLGATPHMLVMTATPIPRTLALTVYGDLDVSVIDELPPGRTPVRTQLFRDKQRAQVYQRVRQAVLGGRQAYVVFPLVEESEGEGMEGIRDATSAAEELSQGPLHGLSVALLHGRMAPDEKDAVMRAFAKGEVQVLVATTVIEVGIDVPNASVMVIEHAERFGLSQLHQLRGRVGRGAAQSECLLLARYAPSEEAWARLAIMEQTTDGFRIAEEDLKIRGPGDFLGTRQSGLPLFTVANLMRDQRLLMLARADAEALLAADPTLGAAENQGLVKLLAQRAAFGLTLARIG